MIPWVEYRRNSEEKINQRREENEAKENNDRKYASHTTTFVVENSYDSGEKRLVSQGYFTHFFVWNPKTEKYKPIKWDNGESIKPMGTVINSGSQELSVSLNIGSVGVIEGELFYEIGLEVNGEGYSKEFSLNLGVAHEKVPVNGGGGFTRTKNYSGASASARWFMGYSTRTDLFKDFWYDTPYLVPDNFRFQKTIPIPSTLPSGGINHVVLLLTTPDKAQKYRKTLKGVMYNNEFHK